MRADVRTRFERTAIPVTETGCWLWTGTVVQGYGRFRLSGRLGGVRAHRAAWELYRGPIPTGMLVCHKCDTRCCVNPDHLFLGSQRDNMRDMRRKGRGFDNSGVNCPNAKLTPDLVRLIRTSTEVARVVAERIGVSRTAVSGVRSGRRWAHVQ